MARQRAPQSIDERSALATGVNKLIDTLVMLGRVGRLDNAWYRIVGGDAVHVDASEYGKRTTYERLFGLGTGGNAAKCLKPTAKGFRGINSAQIARVYDVLRRMGYLRDVKGPNPLRANSWIEVVTAALTEFEEGHPSIAFEPKSSRTTRSQPLDARPRTASAVICGPHDRLIMRDTVVEQVIEELERSNHVGLRGIAGCGKSVLAQQVADRLRAGKRDVLIYCGAVTKTPVALSGSILSDVSTLALAGRGSSPHNQTFGSSISRYKRIWSERSSSPRYALRDRRFLSSFSKEMGSSPISPNSFLTAVAKRGNDITDLQMLSEVAELLRDFLVDAIVMIDDLQRTRPLPVRALFQTKMLRNVPVITNGTKLISTSRSHYDHDIYKSDEIVFRPLEVSLSRDEARSLIAKWSARDHDRREESEIIAAAMNDKSVSADIDSVIAKTEAHPQALAIMAANWGLTQFSRFYWGECLVALDKSARELLQLRSKQHAECLEQRHQGVAEGFDEHLGQLDQESRERYMSALVLPVLDRQSCEKLEAAWRDQGFRNRPTLAWERFFNECLLYDSPWVALPAVPNLYRLLSRGTEFG